MANILSIESSGEVCSVALHTNGDLTDILESDQANVHGEKLGIFIKDILNRNPVKLFGLNAIALSEGPGSYTGLRIGVSLAKGLCYASRLPLIAVDTLQSLAYGMLMQKGDIPRDSLFLPMIDARRMEVYTAGFDLNLNKVIPTRPVILDETFPETLQTNISFFTAGSGSHKISGNPMYKTFTQVAGVRLSSHHIGALALKKFEAGDFVDIAYFEPVYLKEFAAIIKKK